MSIKPARRSDQWRQELGVFQRGKFSTRSNFLDNFTVEQNVHAASVFDAGSRTRPFESDMLGILLCRNFVRGAAMVRDGLLDRRMRAIFRGAGNEQIQNRHADRKLRS